MKMNPALLKKQLTDNANDIQDFCKDLQSWGQEMKLKEESLKKPSAKGSVQPKSAPKAPTLTDYTKWDKYDADLECERVEGDDKDDSELTDEFEDAERDKALVHKEKGNAHVKSKNWAKAIESYTAAINCYQYDPIFYANRALCHLKLQQYESAETDCTLSLRLDSTYVKALQRRSAAREALDKLDLALTDLELVLTHEPKNTESLAALERLKKKLESQQQRPISKFTASRKPIITSTTLKKPDTSIVSVNWPDPGCEIIPVKAINKPVQLRSKKPLKRIEIVESGKEAFKRQVVERVQMDKTILEKKPKEMKNSENMLKMAEFVGPKTSVQFLSAWKTFKNNPEAKYEYLKLIDAAEIPNIFRESMESEIFSDILKVLVQGFIKNIDNVYDFLCKLTEVKRFSALTMFMDSTDKNNLWILIGYLRGQKTIPDDQIDQLIKIYEL